MNPPEQQSRSLNASGGACPRCSEPNAYTSLVCITCGTRLPWADAVAGSFVKIQSSPSGPPSVRAHIAVNPQAAQKGIANDLQEALGQKARAAMLLVLLCGGLMGAALVGPYLLRPAPSGLSSPISITTQQYSESTAQNNSKAPSQLPPPIAPQPNPPAPAAPLVESSSVDSQSGTGVGGPATPAELEYTKTLLRIQRSLNESYDLESAVARATRRAKLESHMQQLAIAPSSTRLIKLGFGAVDSLMLDGMKEEIIAINKMDSAFEDHNSEKIREAADHLRKAGAMYGEAGRECIRLSRQINF